MCRYAGEKYSKTITIEDGVPGWEEDNQSILKLCYSGTG